MKCKSHHPAENVDMEDRITADLNYRKLQMTLMTNWNHSNITSVTLEGLKTAAVSRLQNYNVTQSFYVIKRKNLFLNSVKDLKEIFS